jgi:hypothetical protein
MRFNIAINTFLKFGYKYSLKREIMIFAIFTNILGLFLTYPLINE